MSNKNFCFSDTDAENLQMKCPEKKKMKLQKKSILQNSGKFNITFIFLSFLGWSVEEVNLLKEHFGTYIKDNKYPSAEKIKAFIKQTGLTRTPPVIKSKLQHLSKLQNI